MLALLLALASGCELKSLQARSSLAEPIRIDETDAGPSIVACAHVEAIKISADATEPLHGSGAQCLLSGTPGDYLRPEEGETGSFDIVIKTENGTVTTTTTVSYKRQSATDDPAECEYVKTRSAAEDCGYAPILEQHRQATATNPMAPGFGKEPESFLQRRKKGC
jgi:hypothetical protein